MSRRPRSSPAKQATRSRPAPAADAADASPAAAADAPTPASTPPPPPALADYQRKRDFARTPEPSGRDDAAPAAADPGAAGGAYVIQKHAATRLHYDLRLELDGVMLSWAVPRGPSYDPGERRMAVRTEDHPIAYNRFEGTIPRGHYGAGTVIVWDRGRWTPEGDPRRGLAEGKLVFTLHGEKLGGRWELVRIAKPGDRQVAWLLFKKRDAWARPAAAYDVVRALPDSVVARPLAAHERPGPVAGGAPAASASASAAPSASAPATAAPRPRRAKRIDRLPGAVAAPCPERLAPQLATLATALPAGGEWRCEPKIDGYRLLARCDGGTVRLVTRGGHDWTRRMPGLARELAALGLAGTWLDGEVMVLGANGLPDFQALQRAFDERASEVIVYGVFDLPWAAGHDLRGVPWQARRDALEQLLAGREGGRLRLVRGLEGAVGDLLASADGLGLEGLMAKRTDAPYVGGRTETWLKLKCRRRQAFVIAGFTDRGGARDGAEIGSLVLGLHEDDGTLVPVGSVGTGWDAATATALKRKLLALETDAAPFPAGSGAPRGRWTRRPAGSERWVRPTLVAQVSFSDWTAQQQLRHARFEGLRDDKPARDVRLEPVLAAPAAGGIAVTHPERVVDAASGLTKRELVRYYESVADWLVPQLKGRACALVRGPAGVGGSLFFQKHLDRARIDGVREHPAAPGSDEAGPIEVANARAVAACAQMNVIEFHTGNGRLDRDGRPDRMVFDLDPGEGLPWPRLQEGALLVRELLQTLGLKAWLKTSGGKGLHLVVPLLPRHGVADVRAFSQAVVEHLARVIPQRFVARSGPANRVGRIFVDALRNGPGATTVAAYSARARPGLGVSMPVAWEALPSLRGGDHWTVATAREHLSFQREDPWADLPRSRQTLARAAQRLGVALED